MLGIIYKSASFDFVTAFNFENTGNLLREMVTGDQKNFASTYASIKEAAQKSLDEVMEFSEK